MLRTNAVTDACRVLLLALYDDMREDGYVCVPREDLARRLGRSERRISERLEQAVDARLLDRVQRGQKGRTASYRALRVTDHSTLNASSGCRSTAPCKGADGGPAETPLRVTHGGPASSKHTGTAAGRAASVGGTSELRNDRKTEDVALPRLRGVAS